MTPSSEPRYWRRRLKQRGCTQYEEFFASIGGESIRGTAATAVIDWIVEQFEIVVGVELPEPEIKAPRGG